MRYIKLNKEEEQTLEQGLRNHSKHHFRQRCQALLLSGQGKPVKELAVMYSVRTRTIYSWMDRWEDMGIAGLAIQPGRGVKPTLKAEDAGLVMLIKKNAALRQKSKAPLPKSE